MYYLARKADLLFFLFFNLLLCERDSVLSRVNKELHSVHEKTNMKQNENFHSAPKKNVKGTVETLEQASQ